MKNVQNNTSKDFSYVPEESIMFISKKNASKYINFNLSF